MHREKTAHAAPDIAGTRESAAAWRSRALPGPRFAGSGAPVPEQGCSISDVAAGRCAWKNLGRRRPGRSVGQQPVAGQGQANGLGTTAPACASAGGATACFARFRRPVTSALARASGSGCDFQCETRQRPRAVGGRAPPRRP